MNESSVLLDIGSNIGIYTLASLIRNISRVYSFEPSPLNFSRLSSFIYENGLQDKSNLFCLGIGNKQSIVYFSHDLELESGLAEFRQCTSYSKDSFPVYLTPLDSLQDIFGIDSVTHLKVDVDGPELSVLNGCHHLLLSNALSSVLVECSINETDSQVCELMKKYHFVVDPYYQEFLPHSTTRRIREGIKARNIIFKKIDK